MGCHCLLQNTYSKPTICQAQCRAPLCFILTTRYSLLPPCRQLEWLERRAGFCPEPKSMLSACPIPNFQLPPCLHPPSPNPQLFLGGRQTSENGTGAMRQRYPHSRMGKRFSVQDRLPQPRSLQADVLSNTHPAYKNRRGPVLLSSGFKAQRQPSEDQDPSGLQLWRK